MPTIFLYLVKVLVAIADMMFEKYLEVHKSSNPTLSAIQLGIRGGKSKMQTQSSPKESDQISKSKKGDSSKAESTGGKLDAGPGINILQKFHRKGRENNLLVCCQISRE